MERCLYLDHSMISYEACWPDVEEYLRATGARLALSLWNLVEIASASDLDQRERRLAFPTRCKPIWMVERINVQQQEVRRFLWREHFGAPPQDLQIFTPHLSVVNSYHTGSKARIGLTPEQWIRGLDLAMIEREKQRAPQALTVLQAQDKKSLEARESECSMAWIRSFVPLVDPGGRPLRSTTRKEILEFCWRERDKFLAACASLAVEDALTYARMSDRKRKPLSSDGIDLQHAVVALAYCDIFLVRDRYVRWCAEYAAKRLKAMSLADVAPSPKKIFQSG